MFPLITASPLADGVEVGIGSGVDVDVEIGVIEEKTNVRVGTEVGVGASTALHANVAKIKTKIASETGLKFFFMSLLQIGFRGNEFPRFQNNITMRIIFPET